MKIGIFGGRFDPVHIAHLRAAIEFYEQVGLDKLIVLPTGIAPHKKTVASADDRLQMVKLAFGPLKFAEIDDREINSKKTAYTIDSLKYYKRIYPDSKLFYLVGVDEFINIERWKEWKECLNLARFTVVARNTKYQQQNIKKDCEKITMRTLDISSSEIRIMIRDKKMINYLLPEPVRCYIEKKELYR